MVIALIISIRKKADSFKTKYTQKEKGSKAIIIFNNHNNDTENNNCKILKIQ